MISRGGAAFAATLGGLAHWMNEGTWRELRYGRGYAFVVLGLIVIALAAGILALWTAKPDEPPKGAEPSRPRASDPR